MLVDAVCKAIKQRRMKAKRRHEKTETSYWTHYNTRQNNTNSDFPARYRTRSVLLKPSPEMMGMSSTMISIIVCVVSVQMISNGNTNMYKKKLTVCISCTKRRNSQMASLPAQTNPRCLEYFQIHLSYHFLDTADYALFVTPYTC